MVMCYDVLCPRRVRVGHYAVAFLTLVGLFYVLQFNDVENDRQLAAKMQKLTRVLVIEDNNLRDKDEFSTSVLYHRGRSKDGKPQAEDSKNSYLSSEKLYGNPGVEILMDREQSSIVTSKEKSSDHNTIGVISNEISDDDDNVEKDNGSDNVILSAINVYQLNVNNSEVITESTLQQNREDVGNVVTQTPTEKLTDLTEETVSTNVGNSDNQLPEFNDFDILTSKQPISSGESTGKPSAENKLSGNMKSLSNYANNFDGHYRVNETIDGKPVIKVILLAYARSGSTFVGELLSSPEEGLYLFEPLFIFRNLPIDSVDAMPQLQETNKVLGDLLDCRQEMFGPFRNQFLNRGVPLSLCSQTSYRVLKIIRARPDTLEPWLLSRQDIKVIHLVRDPRALTRSLYSTRRYWGQGTLNTTVMCQRIRGDMRLGDKMGENRYKLVRYEDLMSNLQQVTTQLLEFIGKPINERVTQYLTDRFGDQNGILSLSNGKFDTKRDSNFDPESWKKEMDVQDINRIQELCMEVIQNLNYTLH